MSNPFDQFDQAPAPQQTAANPFDQFDQAPEPSHGLAWTLSDANPTMQSVAHGAGALVARPVMRGVADIVDFPANALNLANQGEDWLTGDGASKSKIPTLRPYADKLADLLKIPQADTPLENAASGVTEAATGGLGMGGVRGVIPSVAGNIGSQGAQAAGFGPFGQLMAALMTGGAAAGGQSVATAAAKNTAPTAAETLGAYLKQRPDLPAATNAAQQASAQSARAGIPLTLGETMEDPNLVKMQSVLGGEPATMGKMQAFNDARDQVVPAKIQALAQALAKPQSLAESSQAVSDAAGEAAGNITAKLSSESDPHYAQAFSMSIPEDHPILKDPTVQYYMDKARADPSFFPQTYGRPDNNVGVLDATKRAMDTAVERNYDPGAPADAGAITKARNNLVSTVDSVLSKNSDPFSNIPAQNPYAAARQVYTGNPDLLNRRALAAALTERDLTNPRAVPRMVGNMGDTATQQLAQALGAKAPVAAQSLIYDALENSPESRAGYGVPGKIYSTPQQQARMATLTGNANAPAIDDTMETVRRAALGEKYRYGSQTQPLEQTAENLKAANAPGGAKLKAAMAFIRGDKVGGILNLMDRAQSGKGFDPETMKQLQELLTTPKGLELMQELNENPQAYTRPSFGMAVRQELKAPLWAAAQAAVAARQQQP